MYWKQFRRIRGCLDDDIEVRSIGLTDYFEQADEQLPNTLPPIEQKSYYKKLLTSHNHQLPQSHVKCMDPWWCISGVGCGQ